VLFLDELAEFRRDVLDQLRQPLEEGEVWISRARQRSRFPCRVTLVGACNPCPCGWFGDPDHPCRCGEGPRRRYWGRLSGPLLDRIDLQVVVRRPSSGDLVRPYREIDAACGSGRPEDSRSVAARVRAARRRMGDRNPDGQPNAQVPGSRIQELLRLEGSALDLWESVLERRRLSPRSGLRLLRVARTIADLAGRPGLDAAAIAEALTFRSFEQLESPLSASAADDPGRAAHPPAEAGGRPLHGDSRRRG
jgi:magnesium chelatase family protein